MALVATVSPSSGPTPGTFTLHVSGAQGSVSVTADPSPPNPNPMPDHTITLKANGNYKIVIKDAVDPDDELFFTATDAAKQTDTASYTST